MDRFSRSRLLLGEEASSRLERAHVTVVGLGAVGGYAVEGLARSGVGRLTLVDFDTVCITNINRQIYALDSTVGRPKVEVAALRVRDINPDCRVDSVPVFVDSENIDRILNDRPDLVVDAIDSLGSKVTLLAESWKRGIPAVSSMGAALRRDPCKVRTGDLYDTTECPLARLVRQRLRKIGVGRGIHCVFSTERVGGESLVWGISGSLTDEPGGPKEGGGSSRRVLGSLPTVTGVFGLCLASIGLETLLSEASGARME